MRTLKYTTLRGPNINITYTFEIGDNSRPHTPRKPHTNIASIGYALRNKVEFHNSTGTFRAYWKKPTDDPLDLPVYWVYSYNALIAYFDPNMPDGKQYWTTPRKYTVTTSRHQGMLWHLTNEAD